MSQNLLLSRTKAATKNFAKTKILSTDWLWRSWPVCSECKRRNARGNKHSRWHFTQGVLEEKKKKCDKPEIDHSVMNYVSAEKQIKYTNLPQHKYKFFFCSYCDPAVDSLGYLRTNNRYQMVKIWFILYKIKALNFCLSLKRLRNYYVVYRV